MYRKNFYKRKKGDVRYLGPYTVVKILDRNKLILANASHSERKKVITHVNEVKIHIIEGKKITVRQEDNVTA